MLNTIILAAALAFSTYCSWYSPEIASSIMDDVARGESHAYLDYDGDGEETILDAIGVLKRYYSNIENGNTIPFTSEDMEAIANENGFDYIYWEIDFIDGEACRKYEYETDTITTIHIYYEDEDICSGFYVELNPYEEIYTVK